MAEVVETACLLERRCPRTAGATGAPMRYAAYGYMSRRIVGPSVRQLRASGTGRRALSPDSNGWPQRTCWHAAGRTA